MMALVLLWGKVAPKAFGSLVPPPLFTNAQYLQVSRPDRIAKPVQDGVQVSTEKPPELGSQQNLNEPLVIDGLVRVPAQQVRTSKTGCDSQLFPQMGHRRYCRLYRGAVSMDHKRTFRGGRCFELRRRKISDGGDYLPGCALRIHRNHHGSLWPPFHPCSAPSGPALGLVVAVRGGHLQPDHGWSCAQSTTGGYNQCVTLAAVQM